MNFQNIPRDDKTVKRAILPKRGAFVFADYSQVEPRLTAYYAAKIGFPEFAEQIRSGVDSYTAVARLATGKAEVTAEERQVWKRIFLAILYGAGVKRVREVWTEETGEVVSIAFAKNIVDQFHRNWPAVKRLQSSVIHTHNSRGFIRTPWGRHLHAEEYGEHKLLNKLIQGSAADLMKQALLEVDEYLSNRPNLEAQMISVIHDEIILDAREAEIPLLAHDLPVLMSKPAGEINDIVPITVDVEVSLTNWAEKMDLAEWEELRAAAAA